MAVDARAASIDGFGMIGHRLAAAFALAAAVLAAGSAVCAPDDDALPKGPAKAMILRVCTSCHGTFDIVHAYGKSTDQWRATLVRMETHGGQFTGEEVQAISVYLGKNFGPAPAAAPPIAPPEPTPIPVTEPPA